MRQFLININARSIRKKVVENRDRVMRLLAGIKKKQNVTNGAGIGFSMI